MGFLVKSEKLQSSRDKKMKASRGIQPSSRNNDTEANNDAKVVVDANKPQDSQHQVPSNLKSQIRAARKKGLRGDVHDLRYLVEEGPLSFRSFGFIGGFFMILASSLDFIEDRVGGDFTPMANLVTFYLWFCGFLIIQLEGRPFHFQIPFLYTIICEFFNFLRFVWGRGFFYFFTGCIQFFLFTKYNMVCGVYFMCLGVFSIVFGYRASVKLANLRNNISNKADIAFLFHSFDKDRDGFLNAEEFREMLMSLDQDLDYNDFVAAMSAVDAGNNQQVAYSDLEGWWESYTKTDLPPGTNMYRSISMQRRPTRGQNADEKLIV
mmetsp:Transcript_25540/g.32170  ORF Transcript_25540/g.32170 Transcript_25540/m.32170 type:complete len:321 (-) Transcript_25540:589-1551(-)|eukprot:CAMPEP_0203691818 /NCGR_PEP_ID=MMETSP0091-20130426/4062_1 /ASSEMBLY_ACC=CAM_ASM_001089 /TAXON_ID=426623 /ORGANISM="Chaetoceros affinis, Strain CCMP159" /LENGTH=320 /DNA_ID=CAMNT_0050562449 /DNA_START=219 /DNA_END=1181 /DNA_ORIENTATION=+